MTYVFAAVLRQENTETSVGSLHPVQHVILKFSDLNKHYYNVGVWPIKSILFVLQ